MPSLLKFAGYINNHKMLPGNIFGLILKNKMAAGDVYSTLNKDFCWPSRAKGIIPDVGPTVDFYSRWWRAIIGDFVKLSKKLFIMVYLKIIFQ